MASRLITPRSAEALRLIINKACQDGLPCASTTVVSNTTDLFHYEIEPNIGGDDVGTVSRSEKGDPTNDRVYWLASCTKLITSIACMQLVEQKRLALDDGDQLEILCPELKDIKVVESDGSTSEKHKNITLRMLLTHTAGFGYSFLNEKLREYNYDEFSGLGQDFRQPLVNQPGERFEYGISMDWAGIAVERATQTTLGHYVQKNIFEPLGIKDLSFVPSKAMADRLAGFWQRDANGCLHTRSYPLNKSLARDQASDMFQSGGAGVWGTTREYSKLLMALLNDGTSPLTGKAILRPSTVEMMFENQLPQDPNFARANLPAVKPDLVYPAQELYPPCPSNEPQGWGLGFMISPSVTGRSRHTGHWSGLSNCFWWCDRDNGVAGIVASQLLPFADYKAVELWMKIETAIYNDIRGK